MSGPPPKPANLRQRTNRKAGSATLSIQAESGAEVPDIPNPDERTWHPLTLVGWKHAWESPMASQWLRTDINALGRLAVLWDEYNKGSLNLAAEIRLQEQRFGLTPLDRSRLQWEVSRADEAELKKSRRVESPRRTGTNDPRRGLMAVK